MMAGGAREVSRARILVVCARAERVLPSWRVPTPHGVGLEVDQLLGYSAIEGIERGLRRGDLATWR